jgi:2-amino-4-hydroxy-6-hydroxymethyldihydropteridine diphosphokinase
LNCSIEEKIAYIGIGSNLGDKVNNCLQSIKKIGRLPKCNVIARSSLFKTEPQGVTGQDWYANCVVKIRTKLTPPELLTSLMNIELDMGRIRKKKWEARVIDLDILLFNQEIMSSESLSIPHPRLHERRFVLEPLAELAPDLIHPILKLTVITLKNALPQLPYVEKI